MICKKDHISISFKGNKCPLCPLREALLEKSKQVESLSQKWDVANFQLKEISEQMETLSKENAQLKTDLELTRRGKQDGER
jgi:predicted nuclease with TOPRIM domain